MAANIIDMKNRRKLDNMNTHDLLVSHMEEDVISFADVKKRLLRIEIGIYAASTALALFVFLINHPNIIKNLAENALSITAYAEIVK